MMTPKTTNERQQARRKREKKWLADHGFTSWEQLHTMLMNNKLTLTENKQTTFPYIPKSDKKGKSS